MARQTRVLRVLKYLVCAATIGMVVLVAAAWFILGDWVPESTTARLPSATQDEVRALLGDPAHESALGDGVVRWFYYRYGRLAEFRVDFNESGRVVHWSYDR